MDDRPSYLPPIPLGSSMRAGTVGVIEQSRHADFPVGRWVSSYNAIEDYSLCDGAGRTPLVDPEAVPSVTNYLSAAGTVGMTAYFGLPDVGRPRAGETVLVSGAAGAVGSLVGQIAKMKGCRTIGIAGGSIKCARLLRDYGYDAAIDYRGKSYSELIEAIGEAAPEGIDHQFENVGGEILDAGLMALNPKGRIVLCGLISQYNSAPYPLRNAWQLIAKGARMEGFIMTHFFHRAAEALPDLTLWLRQGKLHVDEHVEEGLENFLPAFLRLFEGTNEGKKILKLI